MVAERRDYVALDWVAAEIGDTLTQAAAALDSYLSNTGDITQLRFCLTYIHQVYGTLKMVEFAGAALLAEEMETTAHVLLADTLPAASRPDALQALKVALARLPAYLQQLQKERIDRPTALLALINDLRALRNDTLITESAIFSPVLTPSDTPGAPLEIAEGELVLAAGKLRQMYQMAMLNYLRGHESRENLNYLAKVCARLAKLAGGLPSEALWKVAIALFEGLLNRSIPLTPAIKSLLQQIDHQIREVSERGAHALRQSPPVGLLKNLLYYIAASTAKTRFISEIKHSYHLAAALPDDQQAIDIEVLASVKAALANQLKHLADDLASPHDSAENSVLILAEARRAQDTTALLGLNSAQQLLHDVAARLQSHRSDFGDLIDTIRSLAYELVKLPQPAPVKTLFNDSEEAQEQLDKAFGAVLVESRNGLEQAKEAIIEFVANQWRHQCLEEVPGLLAGVRGGLQLAGMDRAANVLAACENYVRQDLLGNSAVPAWQLLDTLADAIASIDYYLERRAEGGDVDVESIVDVAEESVAALGYPVDGRIFDRPTANESNVVPFPTPADDSERYDDHAGLEAAEHDVAARDDAAMAADGFTPELPPATDFAEQIAGEETAWSATDDAPADAPDAVERFNDEPVAEAEDDEASLSAADAIPTLEAAVDTAAELPLTVAPTATPAFADGEEPDAEIAEIFVEETGEVLATLDEYLPQWQQHPNDAESLSVIRRGFHTLKGSGRMVGAAQIGELAWSVENMLNRVIDGSMQIDAPRVGVVIAARTLVPGLVAAFEQRVLPDMTNVQPWIERATLLTREQSLPVAPAVDIEIPTLEAIADDSPDQSYDTPEVDEPVTTAETDVEPAATDFTDNPAIDDINGADDLIEDVISAEFDAAESLVAAPTLSAAALLVEPAAAGADLAEPPLVDDIVVDGLASEPFAAFTDSADFNSESLADEHAGAETDMEPADETDEESDRVLLEIFASEATTHLETLDAYIRNTRGNLDFAELDDHLQRALHTLKGSAHMAAVGPIADVVTPIEHLVKELRGAQLRCDDDLLELLEAASLLLHRGLAQLDSTPFAALAGAGDWAARVAQVYHAKLDPSEPADADAEAEDTYSTAQLGQFLGDAIELISAVADDLALWQAGHLADERHTTLPATIAQVADSAEALNIGAVSDLAQAFQSLLRRNAHETRPEQDFFDLGLLASDRLIDMLDRLAANQEPAIDESLLTLLQDYEPGELDAPLVAETGDIETDGFAVPDAASCGVETIDSDVSGVAAPALDTLEPPLLDMYVDEKTTEPVADGPETADTTTPDFDSAADVAADTIAAAEIPTLDMFVDSERADGEPVGAATTTDTNGALAADLDAWSAPDAPSLDELAELASAALDDAPFANDPTAAPATEDEPEFTATAVGEFDIDALDVATSLDAPIASAGEPLPEDGRDSSSMFGDDMVGDELLGEDLLSAENGADTQPDFGADDLMDFDTLDGETVDLEAAFAATPHTLHSNVPSDAVNEYLEAFVQPGAQSTPPIPPMSPPPLPTLNANSGDDSSDAEIDAEILEIFLEEAGDLLEGLDETLHAWSNERDSSRHLDELQRLLHTLKGGARLAGLKNLGNLAHNFETLLINTQHQQREVDDALLAQVLGYQDQLVRMVEAVKAGGHDADALTEVASDDSDSAHADQVLPDPEPEVAGDAAASPTAELEAAEEAFDELDVDDDSDGVIVPFVRTARGDDHPRSAGEFLATPLGGDVEELPDMAASALLRRGTGPQEVVKISAQLLEQLVNLAGETSIARSRSEEQVNEFVFALDEMQITVDRLQEQVRRLDIETEAQVIHRQEQVENTGLEGFDPLEFDRYSLLQQLSRSLLESASDLVDIKNTLADKSRDMETLLVQQARINTELQEGLMRSRMVPFARMVPRLRRIVRQVAGELGKQVDFLVDNAEGELDRTVLERIVAPLEHMLRNAVDHGIETPNERHAAGKSARGTILLSLAREGSEIALRLSDDGRGINLNAVRDKAIDRGLIAPSANISDHEVLQFILESGFSTAKQVTQISGRGVGMDVVASEIKQLGGSLDIDSTWGNGTFFTVRLPFTVSVNRALMVNVGGDIYAIPLNSIEGIVRVSPFELEAYYQPEAPLFEYAGQPYQMRYMGALLHAGERPLLEGQTMPLPVLLVRGTDHSVAVQVDGLMGSREIVVKTLGPQFGMVHGLSGATVLGDGSVVVILDLMAMIRADALHLHRDLALGQDDTAPDRSRPQLVMVVDDSVTVRKVTSRFLERQGMEVMLAKDGVDAISLLQESDRVPDVMLLDIEMPRMDGFEVASRIRHSSRWQDLPIIMITSRTGEKHRERAFSLGVNRYLGKPYQEMVLLETIYELTGTAAPV